MCKSSVNPLKKSRLHVQHGPRDCVHLHAGFGVWGLGAESLKFRGWKTGSSGFVFEQIRTKIRRSSGATQSGLGIITGCMSSCRVVGRFKKQLLRRNVKRFRGGLVFKARRLEVSLNSRPRVIKKKEKKTDE